MENAQEFMVEVETIWDETFERFYHVFKAHNLSESEIKQYLSFMPNLYTRYNQYDFTVD